MSAGKTLKKKKLKAWARIVKKPNLSNICGVIAEIALKKGDVLECKPCCEIVSITITYEVSHG